MPKREVYDWTDLLYHAVTMGYFWNQAHKLLECFCAAVQCPELKTYNLERSELEYDDVGNPDARKIAKSWFESIGNPDHVELL